MWRWECRKESCGGVDASHQLTAFIKQQLTNCYDSSFWFVRSFHDLIIETANAERTRQASDAITCVIVNIRDYSKKPYLSQQVCWIIGYRKKSGCINPLIYVVNKYFCIPVTSVSSEMLFSQLAISFVMKEADLVQILLTCSCFSIKMLNNYICFVHHLSPSGVQLQTMSPAYQQVLWVNISSGEGK